MQDFKEYSKSQNDKSENMNIADFVKKIASKFDGKSEQELYSAVFNEAKKRKEQGKLSNDEIDKFKKAIYPFLDNKKREYLDKIVEEIKRI